MPAFTFICHLLINKPSKSLFYVHLKYILNHSSEIRRLAVFFFRNCTFLPHTFLVGHCAAPQEVKHCPEENLDDNCADRRIIHWNVFIQPAQGFNPGPFYLQGVPLTFWLPLPSTIFGLCQKVRNILGIQPPQAHTMYKWCQGFEYD